MISVPSNSLPPQDHGGDVRQARERFGLPAILDFSASINPLGTPPGLRDHLFARWPEVLHYPDRSCRDCAEALAQRFGVMRTALVVGNGSAELVDLLLRSAPWRRLLLSPPDFGLYRALLPGATPVLSLSRIESQGFAPDVEGLAKAVGSGDLVLLSNPGNPSGAAAPAGALSWLLDRCTAVGAVLAVDEAFADFCPEVSLLSAAGERPGLVVLRSLTKFYGIPGLRLGFLAATPDRARAVAALQVPWSVNVLAQAAAPFCVSQRDWEERSRVYVDEERERLATDLRLVPGIEPLGSRANYLLLNLSPPAPPASLVYEALARRGILVRHCGSFGLAERCLRVAVRTREEDAFLARALAEAVSRPHSDTAAS